MNFKDILWSGKCGDVAQEVKFRDHLNQFATLATRLDSLNVTRLPFECHVCHVCHLKYESKSENSTVNQTIFSLAVFRWLTFVIEEGHIEPSQPSVGQRLGWPQRLVAIKSLWIDFCCWCSKQKVPSLEMPDEWEFYELLDHLFIRHRDKYEFPALTHCREIFAKLRGQHECS